MVSRAQELADRFAHANDAFVGFVETVTEDESLIPVSGGDPRGVGVVAQHVAWGCTFEQRYFEAFVQGHPLPPVADIHTVDADLARELEGTSRAAVLAELRAGGGAAASWIRALNEEQLARAGQYSVGGSHRTVDGWIDRVLVGHIRSHLGELRDAVAR